jgi:hypothetical protein
VFKKHSSELSEFACSLHFKDIPELPLKSNQKPSQGFPGVALGGSRHETQKCAIKHRGFGRRKKPPSWAEKRSCPPPPAP